MKNILCWFGFHRFEPRYCESAVGNVSQKTYAGVEVCPRCAQFRQTVKVTQSVNANA